MPQFRKKPVVVEAMQLPPSSDDRRFVFDAWTLERSGRNDRESWFDGEDFVMTTAQGQQVRAKPGEWIVPEAGMPGRFYPIAADVFAATYEPVEKDWHATAADEIGAG